MSRLKTFFSNKTAILVTLSILIIAVAVLLGFKETKVSAESSVVREVSKEALSVKNAGPAFEQVDRQEPVVLGDGLSKAV